MNVLALSGSLREASINSAFCRAAVRLAPSPLRISVFTGLGDLPLFNPDLERCPPPAVQRLRLEISRADALLIASPEYAHGISGVMKNALDWLVSHEGIVHKPIAVINTSPRAHHALDALQEVLRTMSTDVITQASVGIPLLGAHVTEHAMVATPQVRQSIEAALRALAAYLEGRASPGAHFPMA